MKKTKNNKTTLHLERETVRVLQAHEVANAQGGRVPPYPTGDSERVCCA
jgi:hypothetical protein